MEKVPKIQNEDHASKDLVHLSEPQEDLLVSPNNQSHLTIDKVFNSLLHLETPTHVSSSSTKSHLMILLIVICEFYPTYVQIKLIKIGGVRPTSSFI